MKVDEAVAFIRQHETGGWVNLNIKTARSGNHYVELDTHELQTHRRHTAMGGHCVPACHVRTNVVLPAPASL